MTNELTPKLELKLFSVRCSTAAGTVGEWTVVTVSADKALIAVGRRLLDYFGSGLVQKLPTHQEISASEIVDPQPADILLTPGLRTEKVTFPAQTFTHVF
jgi:hypothetical protein